MLHSADPQLAANSRWGSGSLAHCGEVDAKFSFSDLEKFKKKKKSTGLGNENYILVNPSTIIPLCCAGIQGSPQSSCFYLLLLTLPYIMAAIPLSKQE